MPYRLTLRAEADLADIFARSLTFFGPRQAERYRDGLKACLELIGDNPHIGRPVRVRPGVRRHEHGRHVIFYREQDGRVLVLAVLHQRRLPDLDKL
ncbi:type II toxin-antitoxin system RelE/ParE family toxin [Enterovirga sp. CN4-39]|uniref:type II toxin-antitoxin system RelE/ParE family toxin n=1 Tax=Enterovirga sp. CN4-39 TaxID=3400910 RepID=UPI003C028B0F